MILTEQEISEIPSFPWEKTVDLVRRVEARIEEKLKAQEPVSFKQFLSDAHTAAGLLRHGKKDRGLADRLSGGVMNYFCHQLPPADVVRDAERYRWLRDTLSKSVGGGVEVNDAALVYEDSEPGEEVRVYWYPNTPIVFYESKAETLDAAIDAAMKGGKA